MTKKPPRRPTLPPRNTDNEKRRLHPQPDKLLLAVYAHKATYHGSSKHKANPHLFDLEQYQGKRGDETLCDRDAHFTPAQMPSADALLHRGIWAGLISEAERQGLPSMLWTIADDGRIYEARITNAVQAEYHGYPVRQSEPIAASVYERFAAWAQAHGSTPEKTAAATCKTLYGFTP